jgi:hypothetical protein
MVLKAIGLISETFKTVESSYSAQDGKITVRKDRQKRTFDVLRWQDDKPELVFTSDNRNRKESLEQAVFVRKAFKELDNA